jgi:hypothetical protein
MPARAELEQMTRERKITDRNIKKFIITASGRSQHKQAASF